MVSTWVGPGGGADPVQPPGSDVVRRALNVSCSASSLVGRGGAAPADELVGRRAGDRDRRAHRLHVERVSPTEPFG